MTWSTEVLDVANDPELLAEVLTFYRDYLVPELVCGQPDYPDRPGEGWLCTQGREVIGVRDEDGRLIGLWVLKEDQVYFPCIDVTDGEHELIAIFAALIDESVKQHGQVWATTTNQAILDWAMRTGKVELTDPTRIETPAIKLVKP